MNRRETILFYPDLPHPRTTILKICTALQLSWTTDPREDLEKVLCVFKWRDTTKYSLEQDFVTQFHQSSLYNSRCVDISKNTIARIHREVFKRDLAVEPTTFRGTMVSKSDRNAAHDGTVLEGPLDSSDPEKTYSLLIDNTEGNEVIDFRVPVFRGKIPLVYIKRRPISDRFSNKNSSVVLSSSEELFSGEECTQIREFAEHIGMDFGELDVLRDAQSGLIWIVDANNTPYGPPNGLSEDDSIKALSLLAEAFRKSFLSSAQRNVFESARA